MSVNRQLFGFDQALRRMARNREARNDEVNLQPDSLVDELRHLAPEVSVAGAPR